MDTNSTKMAPSQTLNDYKADVSGLAPASEYDTEMARLDVDVSTRNSVVPDAAGTAAGLHTTTDGHLTDIKGTAFVKDTSSMPQCLTATGFNTTIPDAAGTAPTASEINAEMVDVMTIDTTSEMTQGPPPETPTFQEMWAYLYFRMRNKCVTTSALDSVYNNAGTTVLFKATISDDGSEFVKEEYVDGST